MEALPAQAFPALTAPKDNPETGGGSTARGRTEASTCPKEPELSREQIHNQTFNWEGSCQAGQRAGALGMSKSLAGKLRWAPPLSRTPVIGCSGRVWATVSQIQGSRPHVPG